MNFVNRIKNAASAIANADAVTVFLAIALCGSLVGIASIALEAMYQVGISVQNGGANLIEYKAAIHSNHLGKPFIYLFASLSNDDAQVTATMRGFGFVLMGVVAPVAAILKGFAPVIRSAITRTFAARAA